MADPGAGQGIAAGYAICCAPRTGSNYLCQALSSTGLLGNPAEYYSDRGQRRSRPSDYPSDPALQTARILSDGATPNGIYGLKLFPFQFDAIAPYEWTRSLPRLHYVFLTRSDLLGQAISRLRAVQTGQWRREYEPVAQTCYDREEIERSLAACGEDEARWRLFFARNGIEPLRLTYEAIVADPQAAVDAVAGLVALSEPAPICWDRVALEVQRGADSDMWRHRFLEEAADPSKLDSFDGKVVRRLRSLARQLHRYLGARRGDVS
jgi:LPS sulfotransferase NodH